MQKSKLRNIKSHYGARWRLVDQSIHSRAILQMLRPGNTLAIECGLVYPQIENLVVDQMGQYHNVLALNPTKFKYQTLDQLQNCLIELQKQTLPQGRIIASFNFQFVNFNRLQKDFYLELKNWINELSQHNIVLVKNFTKFLPSTNVWGDCFFIFENHEISYLYLYNQARRQN